MHMDPLMPLLTGVALAILLIGLILRRFKQPHVVGYLIVGVILGPSGVALITDPVVLNRLGSIGVLLLLFFVGMEISLPRLVANWRVAVIGTLLQILISVACVAVLGAWLEWPYARSILLGFVISLSSTAVVIKILQEWKEVNTEVGQDVIGVLIVQDLAIIPMLITINFLGGSRRGLTEALVQILGGLAIIGFLFWLTRKGKINLPLANRWRDDHEMQVFAALAICLGLAFMTDLFHLSTALGAFLAGIVISSARETDWVHKSMEPLHVIFVAFFFVSIGLLLDLRFVQREWPILLVLLLAAFLTNTFINAGIMRMLGINWKRSLYAGAMLSQIGEFSFVLAAVGSQAQIISDFAYQTTIAVISLTLVFSPGWIVLFKRLSKNE